MRECLGCETYAKYTHTRVSSCAHFMSAFASVRPSVFVSPSLRERFALAAPGFYLAARVFFIWARVGPSAQRGSARRHRRRHVADVVASVRNVSTFAARYASLSFARFIVHARRLTANCAVRLLWYGLHLYKRRKWRDHFRSFSLASRKSLAAKKSQLVRSLLISELSEFFYCSFFYCLNKCAMSLRK